ncbi:MAG: pentapeptide repeat-containing protein [Fimbriimonadaceae bacterium]
MTIKNRHTGETVFETALRSLSGIDLRGASLADADLRGQDLRGADLRLADLCHADLREAKLNEANLYASDLSGSLLERAELDDANLEHAKMVAVRASGASFRRVRAISLNAKWSSLTEADFSDARLDASDFDGADLRRANLSGCSLERVVLSNTNLAAARLYGATVVLTLAEDSDFSDTDFSLSEMTKVTFIDCTMNRMIFARALVCNLTVVRSPGFANARDLESANVIGRVSLDEETRSAMPTQRLMAIVQGASDR